MRINKVNNKHLSDLTNDSVHELHDASIDLFHHINYKHISDLPFWSLRNAFLSTEGIMVADEAAARRIKTI